jgi:hypothetical protein
MILVCLTLCTVSDKSEFNIRNGSHAGFIPVFDSLALIYGQVVFK